MERLIILIKRYSLEKYVLSWAGAFRLLFSQKSDGFTIEDWMELNGKIDKNLAYTIFRILEEEGYIYQKDLKFRIKNEQNLQRFLELINIIVQINFSNIEENDNVLLWTVPREQLYRIPNEISENFNYLLSWLRELILTANERIIFLAPYFSESGIRQLLININSVTSIKQNLKIEFIVSDMEDTLNKKAFEYLINNIRLDNNNCVKIYEPVDKHNNKLWFHAKLLLVDRKKGYLGSANYSERALSSQFELGVPLIEKQANALPEFDSD
ncbi:phospholipase D family protein [Geobacillus stearothermophilus]|nr:phospholipase D family protein [Geobacillus stearothermophilus]